MGVIRAAADAAYAPRATIAAATAQGRLADQQRRTARIAELRSRITLNQAEACELLGISPESFVKHARPKLRSVDLGPTLYLTTDIERLVEDQAQGVNGRARR